MEWAELTWNIFAVIGIIWLVCVVGLTVIIATIGVPEFESACTGDCNQGRSCRCGHGAV